MPALKQNTSGFTLVELLVALTIFAVGLLAIAGMQITSIRANAAANAIAVASSIAEGVLEDMLARGGGDPLFSSDAAGVAWDLDDSSAATTLDVSGAGEFQAEYSVDVDNPVANLSRIDIEVFNDNHSVVLTAYKRTI